MFLHYLLLSIPYASVHRHSKEKALSTYLSYMLRAKSALPPKFVSFSRKRPHEVSFNFGYNSATVLGLR